MRRTVVIWIVALLVAGLAVERHPVERALGLSQGVRSVLAPQKTKASIPSSGQGSGRSSASGTGKGGATQTSSRGSTTAPGAPTVSGTSPTGQNSSQGGSGTSTGSGTGSHASGGSGQGAGGGSATGHSGGGNPSEAASGGGQGASGGTTAPPVSSYPGASTVISFYQAVGGGNMSQAYAMLAPSLTQSQSEATFAAPYQGTTAASVESIQLESAANFTYTYRVTVSLTVSGGTRTVSGRVTVQNASAGVGTPKWEILSLPAVPAA